MSLLLSELTEASKGERFDVTLRLTFDGPDVFRDGTASFHGLFGTFFIHKADLVDLKPAPPEVHSNDIYLDDQGSAWRAGNVGNPPNLTHLKTGMSLTPEKFFQKNKSAVRIHREP